MTSVLLAASITVGSHPQGKLFGLTVNLDTLWATGAAMLVVMVLGLVLRARATSGVPGKLQLVWEAGVGAVQKQVETSIGPRGAAIVPLAVALFLFILVANWFEVFGLGAKYEFLPAPTGDINLPLGMALFVIVLVHGASIKSRGPIGYVSHYLFQPFPKFLFPLNLFINVVEEVARPLTLALRLFGNLLSGGLMLALIAALAVWHIAGLPVGYLAVVLFDPAWKLFDVLLIGPIQAFIFSLLTLIYFDVAMQHA
ncbi:MAG: F0F1 ATP synthase subunit A [Actinobacteria bacterium]|jgi:F-type H+-transporting ATPase subunit a|nr:F0F1 ATP synthase subunit A [Actinomycetota bacterium]MDA8185902.1 F0F1 ATP synthase subunit A [Actinomycetota bacterium]